MNETLENVCKIHLKESVWNLNSLSGAIMKQGQRDRLLQQLHGVSRLPGSYTLQCASPQRTAHAVSVHYPGGFDTVMLSDMHM